MIKEFYKLVRDRVPGIIRKNGEMPYIHIASGSEYESFLDQKLDEEIGEFRENKDPRELADVLEVIYALADFYGMKPEELDLYRDEKAQKRGRFDQRIILDKVEE